MSEPLAIGDDLVWSDGLGTVVRATVKEFRETEIVADDWRGGEIRFDPSDFGRGLLRRAGARRTWRVMHETWVRHFHGKQPVAAVMCSSLKEPGELRWFVVLLDRKQPRKNPFLHRTIWGAASEALLLLEEVPT